MFPQRTHFLLSSHIPNEEREILYQSDGLHVESNCGDCIHLGKVESDTYRQITSVAYLLVEFDAI